MSLKNDFLTGPSGLEQNISLAFAAGVQFVGTGAAQVSNLSLGDRNGANLAVGAGDVANSFDINGPSAGYRVWISVSGEIAPPNSGRTLVQVTLLNSDSSAQAAVKIGAALAAIGTMDFQTVVMGNSIQITCTGATAPSTIGLNATPVYTFTTSAATAAAGAVYSNNGQLFTNQDAIVAGTTLLATGTGAPTASGTLTFVSGTGDSTITFSAVSVSGWGSASASVVTPGVAPTGNYSAISAALKSAAAMGSTCFVLTLPATYNPTALRANNGNNLILKAYVAGILYAFADESIYNYEVMPALNVSDRVTTSIDLNFNFSYNQTNTSIPLNNNPNCLTTNLNVSSCNGGTYSNGSSGSY